MPKGGLEEDATLEECAISEVREESGLNDPRIVSYLGTGESRFAHDGRRYERIETYFLMTSKAASGKAMRGDWEREIERCLLEEAEAKITYPVERAAVRWARAALDAKPA
jgi:ADP-ribose pyrophosphatase YjhB (NUDIX family)